VEIQCVQLPLSLLDSRVLLIQNKADHIRLNQQPYLQKI
jgi:hypothetical protein